MSVDPEQLRTDFSRFMMSYRFGIAQLMTRVKVLEDEFTHINRYNPIEHVTSRVKTPESIIRKAQRIECPLTLDDVRANILDIAGCGSRAASSPTPTGSPT